MTSFLLRTRRLAVTTVLGVLFVCISHAAQADTKSFRIDSKNAVQALMEFGRQAGTEVFFGYENVKSVTTNAIEGEYEPLEALRLLLKDTGLRVSEQKSGVLVVEPQRSASSGANGQAKLRSTRSGAVPIRLVNAKDQASVPNAVADAGAQSDAAQRSEPASTEDREVTVTGSRLKRTDYEGPSPVLRITREEIERTGAASMSELVRQLPVQVASVSDFVDTGNVGSGQSGINLRGLGNGSTLTLINGRRYAMSGNARINGGNVSNINSIPLGAVDRVEILKDGASAIYGSDAIAGVVNIILRKNYTGTEVTGSYRNTVDSDSAIKVASLTSGFSVPKGSGLITIESYSQNFLMAKDRDFSASPDQRRYGGLDQRTTPGIRGTVFAATGNLNGVTLPNGQPTNMAAIPAGQNGVGLTPASFNATAGVRDVLNQNEFNSIVPERKTLNFTGIFDYALFDKATVFGQAAYSNTRSATRIYNVQVSNTQLLIPATNPFNPFGQAVRVEKNLVSDFGYGDRQNDYDEFNISVGLRGELFRGWEWEAAYTYGRSATDNSFNPYNLNKGTANAASTNPDVAYNWFGDPAFGAINSQTKIAAIQGEEFGKGLGSLRLLDASIRGDLFTLGGNTITAVLGAEQREDHYEQAYISSARDAVTNTFTGIIQQRTRETSSVFAEVAVPLLAPGRSNLTYSLELSLAGRYEDSKDFGTTTDPRVGIRWQPVRDLLLRASYGTSFRGPTANESGNPIPFTASIIDRRRNNETLNVPAVEQTLGLGPETSTNYSFGFVYEPQWIKGLSVGVDYFLIDYTDKFTFIFPQNALDSENLFGAFVTRGAPTPADITAGLPGQVIAIRQGFTNAASVKVDGFDMDAKYTWATGFGTFNYGLLASYAKRYSQVTSPGLPAIERVGTNSYPPKWRGNSSLFWTREALSIGATLRYVHSYLNSSTVFNPLKKVDAMKQLDVQASYEFPMQLRATIGVQNVTNEDPPFYYASSAFSGNYGYDNFSGFADPRKATYYLNLRKEF